MVEVAIALQKRRFGRAPGGRRGGAAGPLAVLDEVGEHSGDGANAPGVALRNPGLRPALELVETRVMRRAAPTPLVGGPLAGG